MDDFDLYSLLTEEVVQAHEQYDRESQPYYEEPGNTYYRPMWSVPFRGCHDSYTTYYD